MDAVTSDLQQGRGDAVRRREAPGRGRGSVVEGRVGGQDRGPDVEQLGHLVAEDGGAQQAEVVDVAAHRGLAVDDVEDLLHDDRDARSEEHTSELQSRQYLVCRLLLEKKKKNNILKSFELERAE